MIRGHNSNSKEPAPRHGPEVEGLFTRRKEVYRPDIRYQRGLAHRAKRLNSDRGKLRAAIQRTEALIEEWGGFIDAPNSIPEHPDISINVDTPLSARDVGRLEMYCRGLEVEIGKLTNNLEIKLGKVRSFQEGDPFKKTKRSETIETRDVKNTEIQQPHAIMATLPRESAKEEFSVFNNDHSGESNIKSGNSSRNDSRSRSSSNSSTASSSGSGRGNSSSSSSSSNSSSSSTRKSMSMTVSCGDLFDSDAKNGATDEELNGIMMSVVPSKPVRHSSRRHDRRKTPAQIRSPTTFKQQDNVKVTVDESLKRVGHWPEFTISEIEDSIQVHPKRFMFSPKVDIDAAAICIERGQKRAQQAFSRESFKHHFSKPKTPSVDSAAQLWRDKAKILGLGRGQRDDPNSSTSKYLVAALFSLASLPKT